MTTEEALRAQVGQLRVSNEQLEAIKEIQAGIGVQVTGKLLNDLVDDLTDARAQVAQLQGQLEAARRDVRNETLQEVADFCAEAISYREGLAAEISGAANLEHRMAAIELRAVRRAVVATLRLAETGAGEVGDADSP